MFFILYLEKSLSTLAPKENSTVFPGTMGAIKQIQNGNKKSKEKINEKNIKHPTC